MATVQAPTRNNTLCDICQQKPKFGNFNFCSKNCAGQAASLCANCHQKPKFGNFEFCGKFCASQAKPQAPANPNAFGGGGARGPSNKNQQGSAPILGSIPMPTANQAISALAATLPLLSQQQGKAGQIAHAIAQALPHVQQFVAGQQPTNAYPQGKPNVTRQRQAGIPMANKTNLPANVNPASVQAQVPPANSQAPINNMASNPGATIVPLAPPTDCLIPGCTRAAYVDPKTGQSSSYCSTVHRQEAVTQGIANACIMCLKMPQSEEDHFCGKACRDEALSAPS
ncbi:hypothetical protein SCHPADRAFT_734247 [Schizopora paradoxa]|uniref:Uncharacterized protein n=1 Tax=Schizopora paradoxa TaxID=27342 RepID=A0A0H2R0D1_9AGAM|nr:hypothetical protein SCHPADRAFT_734247 [Schizopora paradoxa]